MDLKSGKWYVQGNYVMKFDPNYFLPDFEDLPEPVITDPFNTEMFNLTAKALGISGKIFITLFFVY